MEPLINVGVEVLRLIPLVLLFYIPALMGIVLWKERNHGYKAKAALMFLLGFGSIIGIHVLFRHASVEQVAQVIVLSLVQATLALLFAVFTVYKLAD